MFRYQLSKSFSGNITPSLLLVYFLLLQAIVADVETTALQHIAKRLLPNECQSIVNHGFEKSPYDLSSNEIDCFRMLVNWASNIRINRRDAELLLGNKLRKIGRNDLASWLLASAYNRERSATEQTLESEPWDSKMMNIGNSKFSALPDINNLIFEPRQNKSLRGSSPTGFYQRSIISIPEGRKLNGIEDLDVFQDRSLVMGEPESENTANSGLKIPPAKVEEGNKDASVNGTVDKGNDGSNSTTKSDEKKHGKSKLSKLFPHLTDDKTATCLRVSLSTALLVLGTIMVLTCCCALLLRNRLVACFERLRKKKPKIIKRTSIDEEQGFMGPRTVSRVPKRNSIGRRGGGSVDVTNVGTQDANVPPNDSNESKELDEKSTGCCTCCARKKKKNRKKRKKSSRSRNI